MSSSSSNTGGGSSIGIPGLLGIAFIVLKLTHVIDWSWWWVTSPFWIPAALVAIVGLIAWPIVKVRKRNKIKRLRKNFDTTPGFINRGF